jgi:AcrR family transcriptional regulator
MATRKGKLLLSPDDWARAALATITDAGPDAVSVERLAGELGVTRGSFYWHFGGRDDVIVAALELWERESTTAQLPALEAIADPIKRLRALLRAVYEPSVDAAELALAAVSDDPIVAPIFARVTERRMTVLREIFTDLGLSAKEAADRAWLAYAFYLGHHQLRKNAAIASRRPERLERMIDLLTAAAPRVSRDKSPRD